MFIPRLSAVLIALGRTLVALIVFVVVELLPGDAATAHLKRDATPEGQDRVRITLGLDRPALERCRTG